MRKADCLKRWRGLPDNANPLQYMRPIPYKATGSRYGACGVRIDGSPEFIDAVLGRLKALLDGENHVTRLECSRNPVDGNGVGRSFDNAEIGAECCYVRLHERGRGLMGFYSRPSAAQGIA